MRYILNSRSMRTRPMVSKGTAVGQGSNNNHGNPFQNRGRSNLALNAPSQSDPSRISFYARLLGAMKAFMHKA